jgi:internalin A
LRSISISNADSLSSLVGLEQLSKLQSLSLYGCPSLNNLMILEKLPNLKNLNAYDTGPLHDLSFVRKLKRFSDLFLTISSKTDLSVLSECGWLQDVNLYFQPGEAIQVDLDMPSLEKISFRSTSPWDEERARPLVSFKKLNASNLDSINFFGVSVESLEGLGPVKDIDFYYCDIRSLAGLEKTSVVALDLRGINKVPTSFDSISSVTTLKRLTLPTEEVVVQQLPMRQLRGLANVEYLDTTGISGSLAWLDGWTSLAELKLEKSGRLIDLDVLSRLPKLETISFRGGVTKKDDLPDSIQSRSTFK